MKVKELIKALSEQPKDAEVFFVEDGEGMYEISKARTAYPGESDELKEIAGEEFVMLM